MAIITLSGPELVDLISQRPATAVAAGDSVAMTLPVIAPGNPKDAVKIRLLLTPEQAQSVALDLTEAAIAAHPYRHWEHND
jgi:hypothetical protein